LRVPEAKRRDGPKTSLLENQSFPRVPFPKP
jgi:hypothetical protein